MNHERFIKTTLQGFVEIFFFFLCTLEVFVLKSLSKAVIACVCFYSFYSTRQHNLFLFTYYVMKMFTEKSLQLSCISFAGVWGFYLGNFIKSPRAAEPNGVLFTHGFCSHIQELVKIFKISDNYHFPLTLKKNNKIKIK